MNDNRAACLTAYGAARAELREIAGGREGCAALGRRISAREAPECLPLW
jgi:hypothetical protein